MFLGKHKEEVLSAARVTKEQGLVFSSWGNVSVRPEGTEKIVITPSSLDYFSLEPADMVVLDFAGKVLEGTHKPSSEYLLHKEIYLKRPDVLAIIHTHSVFATAFAAVQKPIPVIMEELAQVNGGQVEVADYALPGSVELSKNCVESLGDRGAVLLARHGMVGVAATLAETMKICQVVEKVAQIAFYAFNLGQPEEIDADDITRMRKTYLKNL